MSQLQMSDVFRILDDQTQRFWTWLFLRDEYQFQYVVLLSVEGLTYTKNLVLKEISQQQLSKARTPLDAILSRCLYQIDVLLTWAQNPDQLERLRRDGRRCPDVGHFDDKLKSVLRHRWYDYSLEELTSLGDELKAFLLVQGTLPAIPKDAYDFWRKCWDCRFSQSVSYDEDDDEEHDDTKPCGCDHLLFFFHDGVVADNPDHFEEDQNGHDFIPFCKNSRRVDWQLELRRKERLRKMRQLVLMQIEREQSEHRRLMERIECPKQIKLSCFEAFREFETRLKTSLGVSRYMREKDFVVYDETDLRNFKSRFRGVLRLDRNYSILYDVALDRWCHFHLHLGREERIGPEATFRGVMVAEGESAANIQRRLDFLKNRPLLAVFDDDDNRCNPEASPTTASFDFFLYLTCVDIFLGVYFPIVTDYEFRPDESKDVIVMYRHFEEEAPMLSEDDRIDDPHASVRVAFGVRRGGNGLSVFKDVVSMSLFWLRTVRSIHSNETLTYVAGTAARQNSDDVALDRPMPMGMCGNDRNSHGVAESDGDSTGEGGFVEHSDPEIQEH